MSEDSTQVRKQPDDGGLDYEFTPLKKAALAVSVLLVVCGALVHVFAAPDENVTETASFEESSPAKRSPGHSLVGDDAGDPILIDPGAPAVEEETQPWSPALFRGGFGLFAGFALGIALRLFVRILGIVVGVQLLLLFLFSYVGWVEVHWDTIDTHVSSWFTNWGEQFASFQRFVTGHLPSAALAGVGTWIGWRRN